MTMMYILASLVYLLFVPAQAQYDDGLKQLGEVCGNRNPCAPGLDCVRAPLRRKCFPISCVSNAVQSAMDQASFDLKNYADEMMAKAGVTTESSMFLPFPGKEQLEVLDTKHSDTTKFLETIKQSPPPLDLISKSFSDCVGENTASPAFPAMMENKTWYYGTSWGIGACASYSGDLFYAMGTNTSEPEIAVLNNCYGAYFGFNAGYSGLLGLAFTDVPANLLLGCKQMFPVMESGPLALQIGFIDCEDPLWLVEVTAGIGGGCGFTGYSSCTTSPADM